MAKNHEHVGRRFVFEGEFDSIFLQKLIGFDVRQLNFDVP